MTLPQTAISHYLQQQQIAATTARQVDQVWAAGMTDDFDASWAGISRDVFETTMIGQLAAASSGVRYVGAVLAETDVNAPAVAQVNPQRFMGGTRDGRPLETLLGGAVVKAKTAVAGGLSAEGALAQARDWLQRVTLDSVRDADLQAVGSGMVVRPKLQGWVRMMNPPSCKRCVILAGKHFRWNTGFQRHPDCDCKHIPSQESDASDFTVDPYRYFNSLDPKAQDRAFGKRDAQAIRDGGDIYRVVNIRARGLADDALKNTPGRNRGWQSRRWGTPSKMTIDDIYASAPDRDNAIWLMSENGFITGAQTPGGNLAAAYNGLRS